MTDPIKLPIAEWAPDLPDYPAPGSAMVQNVIPRTKYSYGSVGSPVAQWGALKNACQGAAAYKSSLGDVSLFAGDINDLYLLQAGSTNWTVASKTAGGYSASGQKWRFAYFNGQVIATDFGDNPQVFTLVGGSAFGDLPGSPPRGKYVCVVKNAFVAFGNTFDSTNGNMPQRVWWCAAGNASDWPLPGSTDAAAKEAGATDLLGPGGEIKGFAPDLLNADAVVFQEFAVRRMTYAGPPDVFTFLPVESAPGCFASDSIVTLGGIAYYWGQAPYGIYAFDGSASLPIGAEKVNKFLFGDGVHAGDVDLSKADSIVGSIDPTNNLVWWAYPSTSNTGFPDKLLCYSPLLQRFSLVIATSETLVRLLSIGYTIDELFTVFGYTVDTVPANFDSAQWMGGLIHLALFDTSHTVNFFTGAPLAATIDTSEMQPVAGRRALVRSARPLIDGATASVSIGHRETLQGAVTYTPAQAINSLGSSPQRTSGRYLRARTTIPASSAWTNFSGVELDGAPQGSR